VFKTNLKLENEQIEGKTSTQDILVEQKFCGDSRYLLNLRDGNQSAKNIVYIQGRET